MSEGEQKDRAATPFGELNEVLRELVSRAQGVLGNGWVGAYLVGSFAVGDFDEHSDVDFIVVVHEDLTGAQVTALNAMHDSLFQLACPWAQHLEGSYFPKDLLRSLSGRGTPIWYLDHGSRSLERSLHDNTAVVRWSLRERGVRLSGPPPAALVEETPVDYLRQEIREVMLGWGRQILANPEQINNRFYQTFAVLSYCRMLHDYQAGTVGSKRTGAEWAKAHLDPAWIDLIDRAWEGRPDPARSVRERADPGDLERTLQFVEQIMEKVRG